jgi:lipoprotein NlpD
VLLALVLAGCATSYDKRGVYYKVRSGDSIWRIARVYRCDVQQLAEFNNIMDPNDVQPGMKLYIPPRAKRSSFKKLPFGTEVASERRGSKYSHKKGENDDDYTKPIQVYRGKFDWPVEGRLTSQFGLRNGRRHDGIDVCADIGTPIYASAAGNVVFVGQMRGYGNIVLIRHDDDFFTAYAHNSKNGVKKGQDVKKGQKIAEVGRTGRATASHLHFEIRHGQSARNPLFFLPERREGLTREARARK